MFQYKKFGGVAQLAIAFGSYPKGRRFESHRRYQKLSTFLGAFFVIVVVPWMLVASLTSFGVFRTLVVVALHKCKHFSLQQIQLPCCIDESHRRYQKLAPFGACFLGAFFVIVVVPWMLIASLTPFGVFRTLVVVALHKCKHQKKSPIQTIFC